MECGVWRLTSELQNHGAATFEGDDAGESGAPSHNASTSQGMDTGGGFDRIK